MKVYQCPQSTNTFQVPLPVYSNFAQKLLQGAFVYYFTPSSHPPGLSSCCPFMLHVRIQFWVWYCTGYLHRGGFLHASGRCRRILFIPAASTALPKHKQLLPACSSLLHQPQDPILPTQVRRLPLTGSVTTATPEHLGQNIVNTLNKTCSFHMAVPLKMSQICMLLPTSNR